jgi:alpha 1,6-mannosyltransferase
MGYTYPIQLTQWALASSPGHPALDQFMDNLRAEVRLEKENAMGGGDDDDDDDDVGNGNSRADPLTRTGPAAVTLATIQWLARESQDFRWNSLTGLKDGGKSKLVQDVLILPITGFRYLLLAASLSTTVQKAGTKKKKERQKEKEKLTESGL